MSFISLYIAKKKQEKIRKKIKKEKMKERKKIEKREKYIISILRGHPVV